MKLSQHKVKANHQGMPQKSCWHPHRSTHVGQREGQHKQSKVAKSLCNFNCAYLYTRVYASGVERNQKFLNVLSCYTIWLPHTSQKSSSCMQKLIPRDPHHRDCAALRVFPASNSLWFIHKLDIVIYIYPSPWISHKSLNPTMVASDVWRHNDSAAQTQDQCKSHRQDLNLATSLLVTQKASNFIGTLETVFSMPGRWKNKQSLQVVLQVSWQWFKDCLLDSWRRSHQSRHPVPFN